MKQSTNALAALVAVAAVAEVVSAHKGCGGGEIMRRNPGGRVVHKRDTTWQQEAQLSGDQSCAAYSYAPWTPIKNNYPTIWQTAGILPGDTDAQSLFATINATVNSKVPNIHPRGTSMGDWTGVNITGLNTPDVCWWTFGQCTTPASGLGLHNDITTVPIPEAFGYGFDDGPNCSHNAFYDYLQSQNQKATMFYIGSNVADWPLQAIRGVEDGHQICVHTWSHQYMTSFSNDVAFAELYYTRKLIKDLLGVTPKCWRPPFGDVDNRIRLIAEGLNLTNIVWSDDSEDWKTAALTNPVSPAQVDANYQNVLNKQKNGTYAQAGPILLAHELTNYTMTEAIKFYQQIKSTFKYVIPIATAYNESHPYAEEDITYPIFQDYINGQINASNAQDPSSLTASASPSSSSSATSGSGSATKSGGSASSTGAGAGASGSGSASAAGAAASTSTTSKSSAGRVVIGLTTLAGALGLGLAALAI